MNEIKTAIIRLNMEKAPEVNGITPKMFKSEGDVEAEWIYRICLLMEEWENAI